MLIFFDYTIVIYEIMSIELNYYTYDDNVNVFIAVNMMEEKAFCECNMDMRGV
jgi:hypothetical protein